MESLNITDIRLVKRKKGRREYDAKIDEQAYQLILIEREDEIEVRAIRHSDSKKFHRAEEKTESAKPLLNALQSVCGQIHATHVEEEAKEPLKKAGQLGNELDTLSRVMPMRDPVEKIVLNDKNCRRLEAAGFRQIKYERVFLASQLPLDSLCYEYTAKFGGELFKIIVRHNEKGQVDVELALKGGISEFNRETRTIRGKEGMPEAGVINNTAEAIRKLAIRCKQEACRRPHYYNYS